VTRDELQRLAADRPLLTPELHGPNDYYGHAALLKRYAQRPTWRSLKVAVEHGIVLNDALWEVDLKTQMPVILCAAPARAELFAARSGRRAEAIGPMLNYGAAFAPTTARRPSRVVVFPPHSSHRVAVSYDRDGFLRKLDQLSRSFQEVVLCLYWKDVLAGAAEPFLARGLECVTAGHMFDAGFLPRLVAILDGASLVYTNEVGSHVLYATLRDRTVWLERDDVSYLADRAVLDTDASAFTEHPNVVRLLELFARRGDDVTPAQRQLVVALTGTGATRTPGEMAAILEGAEASYRATTSPARRLIHLMRRADWLRRAATARLLR
jgi:hypothetical protein